MADRRLAWALVAVIVRYLATIQPLARRELARWKQRAHTIPDPELRAHVLRPFDADMSAEGAALFAVLAPRRRHRQLIPLLVAYVLLWSYVDVVTERDPGHDPRLYDALLDALTPTGSASRYAEAADDHGYLLALLRACGSGCRSLPSWDVVSPCVVQLAAYGRAVQSINHGPRDRAAAALRWWGVEYAGETGASWQVVCAAASGPLAIHALLALAARPHVTDADADATAAAYFPWVSALSVLADHFIDAPEDAVLANHTYLRYLTSRSDQAAGLRDLATNARWAVSALRDTDRHVVILAAMAAMFLSDGRAHTRANLLTADAVLDAIGFPARPLLAILRVRRCLAARAACRPRSPPDAHGSTR